MLGSKPNINSWTVIFITFFIFLVKNLILILLLKVQIRKLYQPNLFPNASVLPIFDKFFGPIETRFRHIVSLKYRHQFSGTWKLFVQLALNQIHIIMRRWCSWRNIIKIVAGGAVLLGLAYGRQSQGWDRWARIQLSRVCLSASGAQDGILLIKCRYTIGWDHGVWLYFGVDTFLENVYFWKHYLSEWMNFVFIWPRLLSIAADK